MLRCRSAHHRAGGYGLMPPDCCLHQALLDPADIRARRASNAKKAVAHLDFPSSVMGSSAVTSTRSRIVTTDFRLILSAST